MDGTQKTTNKTNYPSASEIARAKAYIQRSQRARQAAKQAYKRAAERGVMVRSVPSGTRNNRGNSTRSVTPNLGTMIGPQVVRKGRHVFTTRYQNGRQITVQDIGSEPMPPFSQPLANHVIRHGIHKGRPSPTVRAQFLLSEVAFPANGVGTPAVMIPLHPNCLGGMFRQLASQYTRFRIRHARVKYSPVVSATTDGAVFVALTDQPSLYLTNGLDMLQMLSTTEGFVQTNVWEEAEAVYHFDLADQSTWRECIEQTADPTELVQAVLYIGSANAVPTGVDYGNSYLELEAEFCEPVATDFATYAPEATISITGTTVTWAEEEALLAVSSAPAAGLVTMLTPPEMPEDGIYILSGYFSAVSTPPTVFPSGIESNYVISVGNLVYVRLERATRTVAGAPDIYATFHTTLQSALLPQVFGTVPVDGAVASFALANPAQLCAQAQGPLTFSFSVAGKLWSFNNMNP